MHLFRELERRAARGCVVRVAVVGAGAMGRGIAAQVHATRGMRVAVLANRTRERAIASALRFGAPAAMLVESDDPHGLDAAVRAGRIGVTGDASAAAAVPAVDVLVEATGTVAHAARTVTAAIDAGKHVVSMNAELDATVGAALHARARRRGVVYGYADGDQPGVLTRLVEWATGTGFEVVAAINCKGFLDVDATPDSIGAWAERMETGARMVCSFTDGTKMQLENAIVANATGLRPEVRGMHGIRTRRADLLADAGRVLRGAGVVDYTLGGDFGGGVLVIGRSHDRHRVGHYLDYLKMGPGPDYVFFRPYHLCHVEAAVSIAEAVLYGEPTVATRATPVVEVVSVAKRDLAAGTRLDGVGGYTCRGVVDVVEQSGDALPIGLAEGAVLSAPVRRGETIRRAVVERRPDDLVDELRSEQGDGLSAVARAATP